MPFTPLPPTSPVPVGTVNPVPENATPPPPPPELVASAPLPPPPPATISGPLEPTSPDTPPPPPPPDEPPSPPSGTPALPNVPLPPPPAEPTARVRVEHGTTGIVALTTAPAPAGPDPLPTPPPAPVADTVSEVTPAGTRNGPIVGEVNDSVVAPAVLPIGPRHAPAPSATATPATPHRLKVPRTTPPPDGRRCAD